jgi:hypothetical protein
MKFLLILIDRGLFADIFRWMAPFSPDFKKFRGEWEAKQQKAQ